MNTKKLNKSQDYKSFFIKQSDEVARMGKTVYISKEHHERIMKITQVIGDNKVSISSYLHNVLMHHFEDYRNEIEILYVQKNSSSVFKPLKCKS